MAKNVLVEEFLVLSPRTGRLEASPWAEPGTGAAASSATPQAPDAHPHRGLLRTVASGVVMALRAIGVVLGIALAALSVGLMVLVQRALHLG